MRPHRTKSEPKELLGTATEVVRSLRTKGEVAEGLLETATEVVSLLRPKSEPKELLDTASDSLAAMRGRAHRDTHRDTLLKAGLIAGGMAALTAGSAAISSLRRRTEASS
jgi:hypothetical protein